MGEYRNFIKIHSKEDILAKLLSSEPRDRIEALYELGSHPEIGFDQIRKALRDEHEDVRAAALVALVERGEVRKVPEILQMLHDESLKVRTTAAWALGKDPNPDYIQPLRETLDRWIRDEKLGDYWAIRQCVISLENLCGDRVCEYLIPYCDHPRAEIRMLVAEVLGRCGGSEHRKILEKLSSDPDERVCREAREALDKL